MRRYKYRKKMQKLKNIVIIACGILFFALYVDAFKKSAGLDKEVVETWSNGPAPASVSANTSGYIVRYTGDTAVQLIPLEEFLTGALAASIDAGYELETLKAQAVLLRGNFFLKMQEKKEIDAKELQTGYLTMEQMQSLWGNSFDTNYAKVKQAVEETKGVVAKNGEEILRGSYHAMSAGMTRNGEEVLKDSAYHYLSSVSCVKNIESELFLQKKVVGKDILNKIEIVEADSAGYVTKVNVNGREMGGEEVRKLLSLPSSNFYIEEGENEYMIVTKGIGHGFGFDQYYADYMAKQNHSDYMTLLAYFFKDISFTTFDFNV